MTPGTIALCVTCLEHKKASRLDYALGVFMIVYGGFLLHPEDSMYPTHYDVILRWGTEAFWGFLILFLGALQCSAIYINSGKGWTPYARMATNYVASITWASVAIGIGAVDPWSTAVVTYMMLSVAHVFCAVTAARDATKKAFAYYAR